METNNSTQLPTTGHGERLTRKQEQAIAAMLQHATLEAAAKAVQVHPVTLTRWLRESEVAAAYREARRDAVTHAIASVQQATSEAVQTLREVMGNANAPAASRVTAAKAVLDTAMKAVELEDLAARVDALEAATPPASSRNGRWN